MDKLKKGSLIANAILIIIVLTLLRFTGCGHLYHSPCAEVGSQTDTVTHYIDRTDTLYKTIATYVPMPVRVDSSTPTDHRRLTADHTKVTMDHGLATNNTQQAIENSERFPSLLPISYYSDSLYRAHEFKAVITDTVLGRILGRSVQWADLTPVTERIVTHTITVEQRQPLVKIYLGASAGVRYASPLSAGGLDIAPAASVVLSDRYMIDVGYYILSNEITAGVKVKLSFHK